MNNDLISREALRNEIDSWGLNDYDKYDFLEAIDNAPTVEPEITNDDLQAAMTESHHLGYELAETKFKRPHGKWIESDVPESILSKCSICGFDCGAITYNFCPSCGADMKGAE